jgi:hypothetical protein
MNKALLSSLAAVFFSLISLAQNTPKPELHGTITTKDGKPLADVVVYSSVPRECCAIQAARTNTDATGSFHLSNPPKVIRLFKDGFAPASKVISPGQQEITIVMEEDASTRWRLQTCPAKVRAIRVGWPYQFLVPKRPKIKRQFGPDYLIYLVSDHTKKYSLVIWFGPLVGGLDADDDWLIKSASFTERSVSDGTELAGQDYKGVDQSGKHWRWTGLSGYNLARYAGASDEAAEYFDRIIDSACTLRDERAK